MWSVTPPSFELEGVRVILHFMFYCGFGYSHGVSMCMVIKIMANRATRNSSSPIAVIMLFMVTKCI